MRPRSRLRSEIVHAAAQLVYEVVAEYRAIGEKKRPAAAKPLRQELSCTSATTERKPSNHYDAPVSAAAFGFGITRMDEKELNKRKENASDTTP